MTRNVRKVLEMKEIMFNPYIPPGVKGAPVRLSLTNLIEHRDISEAMQES